MSKALDATVTRVPKVGEIWGRRAGGGPLHNWREVVPFVVKTPPTFGDSIGWVNDHWEWGHGEADGWYVASDLPSAVRHTLPRL